MAIEFRSGVDRKSVHPSITEHQISALVENFYGAVRKNDRLRPLFEENVHGDWDVHLAKMKTFWRSVLLKTGEYKGKPLPVHQKIAGIETDDFEEWLGLFSQEVEKLFVLDAAMLVNEAARRIATSLWLARSPDPTVNPPDWQASDKRSLPSYSSVS